MRNRSIRFKITFVYTIALILLIGLTLFVIRLAADLVLRNTIREYLVSVVEANTDEIFYVDQILSNEADPSVVYVSCGEGYLQIDEDFMNTVHDVNSAIYSEDGVMIYGENPLAKETDAIPFTQSQLWSMKQGKNRYNIYDRKLNLAVPGSGTIWLRGIVSEAQNVEKLANITRTSLLVLPFLILLAILFGYFISGRMLSPIRKLEQTASRISKGTDLDQRIETGQNKDELAQLGEVFNDMIDRLDQSFDAERRFTSDASHELRTPMSVILAQTEYTLEKERSAEEYKEALGVISRQSERMNLLINDMLDYTRMDQGAERYPMHPENLSAIAQDMTAQMQLLRTNGIRLESEIVPDLWVSGNRILLTRLLQNLITNAYRYGHEDGWILVTLKRQEEKILLSVRDNGIGIAKEEQEKIFERFYRNDASRSVKGTGLGLSMVKKIVELHEAELVLESETGTGSDFRIKFSETGKP